MKVKKINSIGITLQDKCIMCGAKTLYDKNTHIDFREYYVKGAGQMCKGCYTKIY